MTERKSKQREIVYVEPPSEVIDKYAEDVCAAMAERTNDQGYNKFEVVTGLSNFLRVVARIQTKHLNAQLNNYDESDLQEHHSEDG